MTDRQSYWETAKAYRCKTGSFALAGIIRFWCWGSSMVNLHCPMTQVALALHSNDMVLLDRITDFGEDFLIAEAMIKSDNILIPGR